MSYVLEPEVAGGWGPGTDADASVHPPVVRRLVYQFEDWFGDDLLETFPCFVVTERLARAIQASRLTGFALEPVATTTSDKFVERNPRHALPDFHLLRVHGKGRDGDFRIGKDHRLVVSDAAFELLGGFSLKHCLVEKVAPDGE